MGTQLKFLFFVDWVTESLIEPQINTEIFNSIQQETNLKCAVHLRSWDSGSFKFQVLQWPMTSQKS